MKTFLVINAHTRENSFCDSVVEYYVRGLKESNFKFEVLNLRELNLEVYLKNKHQSYHDLSEEILAAQDLIRKADHLTFVYPLWWSSPPAILKLFIENTFIPGFGFKFHKPKFNIPQWDKLLKGKSASLFVTMDSPPLINKCLFLDPNYRMMKLGILNFCGIKPVKRIYLGPLKMLSDEKKSKLLQKVYKKGKRGV